MRNRIVMIDKLITNAFDEMLSNIPFNKKTIFPVNIKEDATGIEIQAYLPEVEKEQVSVHVDNGSLVIEVIDKKEIETKQPLEYDEEKTSDITEEFLLIKEFSVCSGKRTFNIQNEIYDLSKIKAEWKNNILIVRVNKKTKEVPVKIDIS